MLGPFLHTPPPSDEEGAKVAWAVGWLALVMGAVNACLRGASSLGLVGRSPHIGLRSGDSVQGRRPFARVSGRWGYRDVARGGPKNLTFAREPHPE